MGDEDQTRPHVVALLGEQGVDRGDSRVHRGGHETGVVGVVTDLLDRDRGVGERVVEVLAVLAAGRVRRVGAGGQDQDPPQNSGSAIPRPSSSVRSAASRSRHWSLIGLRPPNRK